MTNLAMTDLCMSETSMTDDSRTAILDAFHSLRSSSPTTPAIMLAERLGISEGALQAARLGEDVVTITLSPKALAARFASLGRAKALTRSRHAVLEQQGYYPLLQGGAHAGLMLDPGGLDLRLLFGHWHWACLIRDTLPNGERLSVQIFDRYGRAVHKLFSLSSAPSDTWQTLWDEGTIDCPEFVGQAEPDTPAAPIQTPPGLAEDWASLSDVHQFFGLLRRHHLTRHQANSLMEGHFTRAVPKNSVEQLLTKAANDGLSIMLFVGNPGCVQIRTGIVPQPVRARGWLNLFAENATLHLDDAAIERVWEVHKPNRDGGVTSLEAFDARGELVLQIYGERREGSAESPRWRTLLEKLGHRHQAA
ncbi:MAG: ChuX/HutX family heme-like substrate-binding protein [Halomonas sp.]|uniref:ChuX/HutX family heme-like substrate-binding protein n=1 Tax=Halomonas sp. TaxID=1486246 RepID=UPI003F908896